MSTPPGKARDYAPGEEQYPSYGKKTIYRDGYAAGRAWADENHNPYQGSAARAIWEAGRARGIEDSMRKPDGSGGKR